MKLDPSLAVDSGLRWGREWTCTANACLTKLLACINLFLFKHMRVIWTKRFLKGTNSCHLRFTTGRVWIYCLRRCSRYHYIASLHLFGPNTEQTQQGYRDESQEFRRTSMFGRSRHLQWTCFWFNRIIYASLLFLFLGDCARIYHIDTYTDTYIRALHIDLQWLMICNVYNYNLYIYIITRTHTYIYYMYVCM